ncbi:patatin-like phospholipase family protein [Rhodovulum tesquicola]|uniref:patatin-like phospholipase family protein n=1 Tax=Rhodovulum tesquicola TaxID=540254 RepID=UPI0020968190|nr:patatin-like phospholipase family protein [Rhodovulum tesquicola]MCO8144941.1 patatin-like phospholipase family protein [Rhodovulum tesquicola]
MVRGRIGVALGSGGARGWCHIGVLRGLDALGLSPDVVAGCSMGALVGAAYAAGRLDALEEWTRSMTRARLVGLLDVSLVSGGLVEGRQIARVLKDLGLPERIEDLDRPFAAIATDMETGREIWLTKGDLGAAVRASAALPGVISPCHHEGRWLLDGGLTNPVPVSAARALGADIIIAVNPNGKRFGQLWQAAPPEGGPLSAIAEALPDTMRKQLSWLMLDEPGPRPPNYLDVVSTAIDVMTEQIRRSRLAGEPPHVLLSAHLAHVSVLDLHRAPEAIEEGRRLVERHAEQLEDVRGS